jgi:predicted GH43/DUF377 family glycosyl hydrolase
MFARSASNPIVTADDLGFEANSVFNPGAVQLRDGSTALLLRVEDRRGLSSIHLATSADGTSNWTIDRPALLSPRADEVWCQWGFEDARVVFVEELDRYVVTCTAYGPPGASVYLAITPDLRSIESGRVVMSPEDKNAALFERRIGGSWYLLHRPVTVASGAADIWMSCSEDLASWHSPCQVMLRRANGWWDAARIGVGPSPIETPEGWLMIYHGVRATISGSIYRVGAALLDLDDPTVVRSRLDEWILSPSELYERVGDVGNVVFPCGAIRRHDTSSIDLYYGAADSVVCMASVSESELMDALLGQRGA